MNVNNVQIEESWRLALKDEFESVYFDDLISELKGRIRNGDQIYPPGRLIFNAFNLCPLDKLKVVILGQDPYHGIGQAMGLCFSVPKDVRVPPSLKNIYKEIKRDLDYDAPNHGDLSSWAEQGVFMLNAILTVEANKAGSHRKLGWMQFTDQVIKLISDRKDHVVFMLWGNFAKQKKVLIDNSKHLILESVHPSPLAGNGFQGNGHFSESNRYLEANGLEAINWKIK